MEDHESVKCEYCNSVAEYRIVRSCQGWWYTKPDCDWAVVTTYIYVIYRDETEYEVYLLNSDPKSKGQIRYVSKVMNCSYVTAKSKLSENPLMLKKTRAPEVIELSEIASLNNLEIFTKPKCGHLTK